MSQDRVDHILRMLEEWYDQQEDVDPNRPFVGFEGLLGELLIEIDLGREVIAKKVEEYTMNNPEKTPPWRAPGGGINLRGAVLCKEQNLASFSGAQLDGANFRNAQLERADFATAQLELTNFREAHLTRTE